MLRLAVSSPNALLYTTLLARLGINASRFACPAVKPEPGSGSRSDRPAWTLPMAQLLFNSGLISQIKAYEQKHSFLPASGCISEGVIPEKPAHGFAKLI
ncbi:hypothetical protein LJ738_04145 [Hymenobacter sp. BT770]|nr:hypothetical protein [Hymenobacter sp. BT770]